MRKLRKILVALGISCMLLGGCNMSEDGVSIIDNLSVYSYDNAEKYTMGGTTLTDTVEKIDINWIGGDVKVNYHSKDSVVFSEKCAQTLNEDNTLYYWLENETLHIMYGKSGKWDPSGLKKELTVWLPEESILSELNVDVTSANVVIDGIVADEADFDSISGDIELKQAKFSDSVEVDTTSGGLTAVLVGKLHEMDIDTISGGMEVSAESIEAFDADSTSGDIKLTVSSVPDSVDVDTISGDAEMILPKEAEFTVELDSMSGTFESGFATRMNEKKYIVGDGSNRYKFDTTSGDVKIKMAE